MLSSQLASIQATTRKTNAEAQLIEADLPFSAANARARSDKLFAEVQSILGDIGNKNLLNALNQVEWDLKELDLETQKKLAPLRVEAQSLLNEATRLGNTGQQIAQLKTKWDTYLLQLGSEEAKASAAFWRNAPMSKWIMLLRQLAGK